MSAKILPAIVVGSLLATTALAAAQTRYYQPRNYAPNPNYYYQQQPQMMTPTPDAYWQDPYAGTPFDNVVPYGTNEQPDPYAGSAFDNVAPY